MSPILSQTFGAVKQTVTQLVAECRKRGPLYVTNPKAVAQVSRTAKWLLNAIERLQRELLSRNDNPAG